MSTTAAIYLATAATLFGIGVYGVLQLRHVLRKLLAVNVMGAAIFLLLITLGGGAAGPPDPVPQAMVLTGIVIAVSATAFALALLLRLHEATGLSDLDASDPTGDAGTDTDAQADPLADAADSNA